MVVPHPQVISSMGSKAIPSGCEAMRGEEWNGAETETSGKFGIAGASMCT